MLTIITDLNTMRNNLSIWDKVLETRLMYIQ